MEFIAFIFWITLARGTKVRASKGLNPIKVVFQRRLLAFSFQYFLRAKHQEESLQILKPFFEIVFDMTQSSFKPTPTAFELHATIIQLRQMHKFLNRLTK